MRLIILSGALACAASVSWAQGAPPAGATHHAAAPRPVAAGQAAFGAVQEIIALLLADPQTDWSKVDVDALRQHLIDMDEVTLRAVVRKQPVDHGLRLIVTGSGRTLEAIRRMVPDQAHALDGQSGWVTQVTLRPDGVTLTATAGSQTEVEKIRGLGFMGIMALGSHHQIHHLMIAKGQSMHKH